MSSPEKCTDDEKGLHRLLPHQAGAEEMSAETYLSIHTRFPSFLSIRHVLFGGVVSNEDPQRFSNFGLGYSRSLQWLKEQFDVSAIHPLATSLGTSHQSHPCSRLAINPRDYF